MKDEGGNPCHPWFSLPSSVIRGPALPSVGLPACALAPYPSRLGGIFLGFLAGAAGIVLVSQGRWADFLLAALATDDSDQIGAGQLDPQVVVVAHFVQFS